MRMPMIGEALAAACVGLLAVSTLLAQRPPASPLTQTGTGLVDIGAVTQNSAALKQSLDALKKEYEASSADFKRESEKGNQLTEKLRKMPAESPEHKKLEQELLKMRADFELRGKRISNDIRDRETKLFFSTLRDIQAELARFAQANGVKLVLRYDPTPAELNDPRAILQEIQKPIVYQRGSEITQPVLEAMNRRGPSGPATGRASPDKARAAVNPVGGTDNLLSVLRSNPRDLSEARAMQRSLLSLRDPDNKLSGPPHEALGVMG